MLHIFICSCQILHDKICPVIQTEYPLSETLETRCVLNFIFFLNVAVFECTKWNDLGMEARSKHKHLHFTHTSHITAGMSFCIEFSVPSCSDAPSNVSLDGGVSNCSLGSILKNFVILVTFRFFVGEKCAWPVFHQGQVENGEHLRSRSTTKSWHEGGKKGLLWMEGRCGGGGNVMG